MSKGAAFLIILGLCVLIVGNAYVGLIPLSAGILLALTERPRQPPQRFT